MNDVFWWLFVVGVIIGVALMIIYPFQPQPENVKESFYQSEGVIMIGYNLPEDEAVKMFYEEYPGYRILGIYSKDGKTIIKAVRE